MKSIRLAFGLLASPIVALAGIGQDILEKDGADEGDSMPEWLIFILLLFVVLMVMGKIKK